MKPFKIIILFAFAFLAQTSWAQIVERVEVKGIVSANNGDVFAVTVYNTATKKGTTTNEKGEFKIKVGVNDVLEIASLLFHDFNVAITQDEIDARSIQVYMIELVNNLDEVVIIKDGLTGFLDHDVAQVKVFNTNIDFSFGGVDLDKYDLSDDYKSAANNIITRQGQYYNMADLSEIAKLVGELFTSKKKTCYNIEEDVVYLNKLHLKDKYDYKFYAENFKIPPHKVEAFIAYVEDDIFSKVLLIKKKELYLLEYLKTKSVTFLAQK